MNTNELNVYGFIYITTNLINGKRYIGKRVIDNGSVWKSYLGSGIMFNRAVEKYGKENFVRDIVAIANSDEELCFLEKEFIKNYNAVVSDNYYNLAHGGKGGITRKGAVNSEETRKKIRENHADFTKENHPLWKPRVDYKCDYCGELFLVEQWKNNNKNKYYCSKECSEKGKSVSISKALKGKRKTDKQKKQMSEHRKGKYYGKTGDEHHNSKSIYLYNDKYELVKFFGSQRECCEWFVDKGLSNKPECLKPVVKRNIDKHKLYKGYYFYSNEISNESMAC